jgi:phage-related protein (TIGR01555 family)
VDEDQTSRTYGEPLYYLIDVRGTGASIRVHRSRVLVFPGAVATDYETRARQGWGISIIDPVYECLQRNATAWASAASAIANCQYSVYKLRGLDKMFSMPGGEERAKARARAMEMAKSMINAVLIDAEDEYVRENPNFGNLPGMLDQFMLDVASALDMPATILWGRSPAGMNATGESDFEHWYTSCEAYREHHLRPRLHEFLEVLMQSKEGPTRGRLMDGWRVHFPGLRQMSDKERADLRAVVSHADEVDIKSGVLMPQEVAVSRFRPEGYSIDTQVDLDLRERLLKLEMEQRETEMEEGRAPGMTPAPPPPTPPPGAPGAPGAPGGKAAAPAARTVKAAEAAE